ncbi:hypothetical protein [Novosphingobium sp.]|uniref:hypothetical protein n=1 Tax=Novosphingobium sp. TaxID=1874826 RepID=UPI003B516B54
MQDALHAVANAPHGNHAAFLQWRLGKDHGINSADLAAAFGISQSDALAMLQGDRPVPGEIMEAGKAALNAWYRGGCQGDIRHLLQSEAAGLTAEMGV